LNDNLSNNPFGLICCTVDTR